MRHFLLSILLSLCSPLAYAQSVYVQSNEVGQGVLREYQGDCYVITPAHVVKGKYLSQIITSKREQVTGVFVTSYDPDIAILRLEGNKDVKCDSFWPDGQSIDTRLQQLSIGKLRSVSPAGSIEFRSVKVMSADERFIFLELDPTDSLFKGLSGSTLLLEPMTAGMLIEIDQQSGQGVVYRQDYLNNILQSFFKEQTGPLFEDNRFEPLLQGNDLEGILPPEEEDTTGVYPLID